MVVPENGTVPLDTTSRSKTIPPGAPPHRDLIDTAHLCFIINTQHTPMVVVFRAVPKPTTAAMLLPTPSTHPLSCTTSCLTHCGVAGGVSDAAGVCCPRPKVPAHATSVATLKGNNPFSPPAAAGEGPHTSKGRVLPPNPPIICRSR